MEWIILKDIMSPLFFKWKKIRQSHHGHHGGLKASIQFAMLISSSNSISIPISQIFVIFYHKNMDIFLIFIYYRKV